jgi:hypothetical protein
MKHLSKLLSLFFCLLMVSSCTSNPELASSPWNTEHLKNGSVTFYAVYNEKNRNIAQERNHIFHEAGNLVLVREIIGADEEEIFRLKMNKSNLLPMVLEVSASKEAEQTVLIKGQKMNRAWIVENKKTQAVKVKQFYLGKDPVVEQEALVFLMASFPFESMSNTSVRTLFSRKELDAEIFIELLEPETIQISDQSYECYTLHYTSLGITAWYMKEAPHLLVQSKKGAETMKLLSWNGI